MKEISTWAREHRFMARVMIVIIHLLLAALGILIGAQFYAKGISLSLIFLLLSISVYILATIKYPVPGQRYHTYRMRKCFDVLLAGSSFAMLVFLGNHPEKVFTSHSGVYEAFGTSPFQFKDSLASSYMCIKEFSQSMKDEHGRLLKWKERKTLLKKQVRAIKQSGEPGDGGKFLLILLSCIVATGLIIVVAGLSCGIACSGSGILAGLFAAVGWGIIIWLLAKTIRRINNPRK